MVCRLVTRRMLWLSGTLGRWHVLVEEWVLPAPPLAVLGSHLLFPSPGGGVLCSCALTSLRPLLGQLSDLVSAVLGSDPVGSDSHLCVVEAEEPGGGEGEQSMPVNVSKCFPIMYLISQVF